MVGRCRWSCLPNFSHLAPLPFFFLRTLSGVSRECEKTTLFTVDGMGVVGWASLSGVTYSSLTQFQKMRPSVWLELGVCPSGRRKNAIHFFSRAVCHFASSASASSDNENRKEKIYVPMLFAASPSSVYWADKKAAASIYFLYLSPDAEKQSPRAQFHFKSCRV